MRKFVEDLFYAPASRLPRHLEIAIDAFRSLLVSLPEEVGHTVRESHSPHALVGRFRPVCFERNGPRRRPLVRPVLRTRG